MKNLNTEYLAISPRYRYQTAKIGPRLMLVRSDADWADLSGWCRCRRRGEITLSLFSKKGQGLLCLKESLYLVSKGSTNDNVFPDPVKDAQITFFPEG